MKPKSCIFRLLVQSRTFDGTATLLYSIGLDLS